MQESKPQGKLSEVWAPALEASGVAQADVSAALSEVLASKDAADIQKAKKAAFLAASVMQKRAVPELESEPLQSATVLQMRAEDTSILRLRHHTYEGG